MRWSCCELLRELARHIHVVYNHVRTARVISYDKLLLQSHTTTKVVSYDHVTTPKVVTDDPVTTPKVVTDDHVTTPKVVTDDHVTTSRVVSYEKLQPTTSLGGVLTRDIFF